MTKPHVRMEVTDDRDRERIVAILGSLGYAVEIVDALPRVIDQRIDDLAADLKSDRDRAAFRAMLVTDDTQAAARLLGLSIGTTQWHEQVTAVRLGLRRDHARLDALRKIAGLAAECTCEEGDDCSSARHCRPGATG